MAFLVEREQHPDRMGGPTVRERTILLDAIEIIDILPGCVTTCQQLVPSPDEGGNVPASSREPIRTDVLAAQHLFYSSHITNLFSLHCTAPAAPYTVIPPRSRCRCTCLFYAGTTGERVVYPSPPVPRARLVGSNFSNTSGKNKQSHKRRCLSLIGYCRAQHPPGPH